MARMMARVLEVLDGSSHASDRTVDAISARLGARDADVLDALFRLERAGVAQLTPEDGFQVWCSDRTPARRPLPGFARGHQYREDDDMSSAPVRRCR